MRRTKLIYPISPLMWTWGERILKIDLLDPRESVVSRLSDPQDLRELIQRVAARDRGLAFLHQGDVEAVALMLHVHPFTVVKARALLDDPDERSRLIAAVKRAREELENNPPEPPAPPPPAAPAPPCCARDLIRAAEQHPYGTSFLIHGYPESVAVVFHVHPDLVFRARDILVRYRRMKQLH